MEKNSPSAMSRSMPGDGGHVAEALDDALEADRAVRAGRPMPARLARGRRRGSGARWSRGVRAPVATADGQGRGARGRRVLPGRPRSGRTVGTAPVRVSSLDARRVPAPCAIVRDPRPDRPASLRACTARCPRHPRVRAASRGTSPCRRPRPGGRRRRRLRDRRARRHAADHARAPASAPRDGQHRRPRLRLRSHRPSTSCRARPSPSSVVNGGLVIHEAIVSDLEDQMAWEDGRGRRPSTRRPGPRRSCLAPPGFEGTRIVVESGQRLDVTWTVPPDAATRPGRLVRGLPHPGPLGEGHGGPGALRGPGGRAAGVHPAGPVVRVGGLKPGHRSPRGRDPRARRGRLLRW